ncbi:MAG: 23S rRNA (adenine(2030)-N(6))-methyltransferase RlmJ [Pseudohongiella sp.]|nr:23S rRNA (adenine(2030)-N(6))-methyltransferase RlmJ [Pseudohongiella sp.]MDP2091396.1 23S rRNA (adenine(2030)-N(6))-methyltransferase RlmJ [Pseudohongiella sp.]MDP3517482.1 23S rRNA (adenine(2030)-N(6))-methyltransferase RlmJ [Pseudohongiella sp.]
MLSYRHAYHAGNHADVLKHLVLLALLQQLRQKEKPFVVIDSHAGNGFYTLDSPQARKTREAESGALPLWQQHHKQAFSQALLRDYMSLIAEFNPEADAKTLAVYPGSPAIVQSQLREQDRLAVMELHTTEIDALRSNFHFDNRIAIHHRDGFEGAVALTPPTPKRGLLLIDPAYEDKTDYQRVAKTVKEVHRRWATGMIAVWYPMLGRTRDHSPALIQQLKSLPDVRVMELTVGNQTEEFGMHGSGMILVNTPWQFGKLIDAAMNEAASCLKASYRVNFG